MITAALLSVVSLVCLSVATAMYPGDIPVHLRVVSNALFGINIAVISVVVWTFVS